MRRTVGLFLAITSLALPAVATSATPTVPRLLHIDVTSEFAVRPATMFFGCCGQFLIGGPGVSSKSFRAHKLGHIRWTTWQSVARGNGLLWINGCNPDCAQGTFTSRPVSITASKLRNGRYTQLLLVYRYRAHVTQDRMTLRRLSGARISAYQWV
jgi:hypothetical protein